MENLKKGLKHFVANHQNTKEPQKIITSKQAIQHIKEKEKTSKKNEDFELGNMQKNTKKHDVK